MTDADPTIKSLYIGDLQDWMDENYIFGLMAPSGEVVNVKIIRNKLTGASEGYGFIECVSHEAAGRVLQLYNGQPIYDTGTVFKLNWATHGQGKRSPSEGTDILYCHHSPGNIHRLVALCWRFGE